MAESLAVTGNSRKEQYASLLPQLKALVEGETDKWASLGNIMSALKYGMNFFWAGIYSVKGTELVLGPFQGTVACTRIAFGKGVCGHCWKEKKVIIVDDVDKFAGHIACSSETRSEIVLPVFNKNGEVAMVLDIDSEQLAHFDNTDELFLKEVVLIIEKIINT
ncbi:MAG TPA: GAF domain-containing protein [Bacteroidia bacterium]|jgi:L-methionine (R)-S-oxide reductase|nr:GAF domain-containing protein [Bacteroidia bacterium]